jgi:hypothetical protein
MSEHKIMNKNYQNVLSKLKKEGNIEESVSKMYADIIHKPLQETVDENIDEVNKKRNTLISTDADTIINNKEPIKERIKVVVEKLLSKEKEELYLKKQIEELREELLQLNKVFFDIS